MSTITSRAKKNMQTKLTVIPFKQPRNGEVIETLIYLLAEASAGRVTSLLYAAGTPDKKILCDFLGAWWGGKGFSALGAASLLQEVITDSLR